MRVCKLGPGPRIGEILASAHELQVTGVLTTRADVLAWLRKID